MSPPRNQILDLLAARLREELTPDVVRRVERRFFWPAPEEMPVLCVGAVTEQANEEDTAANPGKWTIRVGCYVWAKDGTKEKGPAYALQAIIDRIEDALKRREGETGGWWTTLGGKVWHAGLVGVDTMGDEKDDDVGLAMVRIEVACKPVP